MGTKKLHGFKFVLFALTMILSFAGLADAAGSNYKRSYDDVALKALTEKLKTDLGVGEVNVKFDKVNQYNVSKSRVGVKGVGKYFINSSEVTAPITFDVKVNTTNLSVADIVYDFEEVADAVAAGSAIEENVTQKLLKQLASDYKTENVTIAVDNLEPQENHLVGTGEIRIGDFEWHRIQFEVAVKQNGISELKYKIQD